MISKEQRPDRPISIYLLVDPRTHQARYVGQTIRPLGARLSSHLSDARTGRNTTRSGRWMLSLLNAGYRPEIVAVEVCQNDDWREVECFWIAALRLAGADLTNHADGGNGPPECTEETRDKRRRAAVGRRASDDAKARMSAAAKVRTRSPLSAETKAKIARKATGNQRSRGIVHSAEAKARMSAAQRIAVTTRGGKRATYRPEAIAVVRRLRAEGAKYADIAIATGISITGISNICTGKRA